MSDAPEVKHDKINDLLRDEKVEEVNALLAQGISDESLKQVFSGTDFRSLHLRGLNVEGLDFSNSYFRMTDIRGIDFSNCDLEGASLHDAQISGCYFPKQLSAEEITLSVKLGTRLRYT